MLLFDNAGCHPVHLQGKYSNIKIVFLPPNTTSKLQPLRLGIICNFKIHYRRRLLLQYVIAKIDAANSVISSTNVLVAIRWAALAWREVKTTTITKCFKKAGILKENLDVLEVRSDDPFLDVDETSFGSLISTAMGSVDS